MIGSSERVEAVWIRKCWSCWVFEDKPTREYEYRFVVLLPDALNERNIENNTITGYYEVTE